MDYQNELDMPDNREQYRLRFFACSVQICKHEFLLVHQIQEPRSQKDNVRDTIVLEFYS